MRSGLSMLWAVSNAVTNAKGDAIFGSAASFAFPDGSTVSKIRARQSSGESWCLAGHCGEPNWKSFPERNGQCPQ
jgi:hypothetical protein